MAQPPLVNPLQAILEDVVRRRGAGEPLPDEAVLAAHPSQADELRIGLARLAEGPDSSQRGRDTQPPSDITDRLVDTIDHVGSGSGGSDGSVDLSWIDEAGGAEVKRFRKVRPHAAGGVGEVWVALDMQLHREVALKELQQRHHGEAAKRDRFLVEGHVTGVLEHPGIVPVYAMGLDAERHPYYAMRLIRGDSLRQAIKKFHGDKHVADRFRRGDSDFRDLLRRFSDVCVTVAYAHSRGVLHRDLKPDNVMLGKYGETYVVDWGMARIVGARAEDFSLVSEDVVRPALANVESATRYGSAMGTPGFMSPEQAAGQTDDIGVATDVYSLGAILYYMLANRAPILGDRLTEFLRKVAAGEFPPPQEINPAAPNQLCAICVKAMATRPGDRYTSARALSADVERWLADEPVSACPPTVVERFARWGRKHRTAMIAGGAALALIAVASTIAALLVNEARERQRELAVQNLALADSEAAARRDADARFRKARETVDVWLSGYSDALQSVPVAGVQAVRARMLELAAEEYEAFAAERSDDSSLKLEQGRTLVRLGSIYRLLGRPEDASQKFAAALDVLEPLLADEQVADEALRSLALGRGMVALLEADGDDAGAADTEFQAAIDQLDEAVTGKPDDVEMLAALVTLWTNRGGVLAKTGDFTRAGTAFDRALVLARRLVGLAPDEMPHRAALAAAEIGAGQVELELRDAATASKNFESAANYFIAATQLAGRNDGDLQLAVTAYLHLASARRRLGDVAGEQDAYARAIDAATKLCRLQPEIPAHRVNLAMAQTDLGQLRLEQYDAAGAEEPLREAAESLTAVVREYPASPEYRSVRGAALDNAAQALQALGRWDEALACVDMACTELRGLATALPNMAPYQERLIVAESTAAQILAQSGHTEESLARFAAVVDLLDALNKLQPATPARRQIEAMTLTRYGDATALKNAAAAAGLWRRAAEAWNDALKATPDPQFACGAAWFFAMCPDDELRDPERACHLAAQALREAPANPRYRLTLAVAQALAGRHADSLATADHDSARSAAIAPAFGFARAIALADSNIDDANKAWTTADMWRQENLPGHWELIALEEMAAKRMPNVEKGSSSDPASRGPIERGAPSRVPGPTTARSADGPDAKSSDPATQPRSP